MTLSEYYQLEEVELFLETGINPQLEVENNFINFNRYTDIEGLQNYKSKCIIDHLHSVGYDYSKVEWLFNQQNTKPNTN